jgi:DNA polymerase IIIc chi subunit
MHVKKSDDISAMSSCIFHNTSPATHERQLFEIVEQLYIRRERVLIYTRNAERATAVDRSLWIAKQEAFIPHRVLGPGESDPDIRVAIVHGEYNPISASALVVDGHCSLDFSCSFDSIHEFVNRSSPDIHEACRDRFRAYRSRQIPVEYSK